MTRLPPLRRAASLLLAALLWACIGGAGAVADQTIALLGDPQIGYGHGAEYGDAARFAKVVRDVNRQPVRLSVIAGDLVQDRSLWQHWAFARTASALQAPLAMVPGNHDVPDLAALQAWRRRHGADYRDIAAGNIALVLLNSETLRDSRISPQENAAQWAFLERTLAAHQQAGRAIVLVMHRPPFAGSEQERAGESNWPLPARQRLLSLARERGVRLIFAGHLHRSVSTTTADGIRILVGAGSARSFDASPIGYHLLRERDGQLQITYRRVAPPPRASFAVPGIPEWTPRLAEFSLRHWLLTALYCATGLLAWRAARRSRAPAWLFVAMLLFAFAANMQLDLDELWRATGRVAARLAGVEAVRHLITGAALLLSALAAAGWLVLQWRRRRMPVTELLAIASLAPSAAWFALSVISHHDLGMLFDEGWWDLLVVLSLALISVLAVRAARSPASVPPAQRSPPAGRTA